MGDGWEGGRERGERRDATPQGEIQKRGGGRGTCLGSLRGRDEERQRGSNTPSEAPGLRAEAPGLRAEAPRLRAEAPRFRTRLDGEPEP